MPLRPDLPDQDHAVDVDDVVEVHLRNTSPTSPVELFLVRIDHALTPFLSCGGPTKRTFPPDAHAVLSFRVLAAPPDPVEGDIELFVCEQGLTAMRTVHLTLIPRREFEGVFAVDFGSSRIAASYIAPDRGAGGARLLEFMRGETTLDTTFTAAFGQREHPLRVVRTGWSGDDGPDNVFLRPRRFLTHSTTRGVSHPGGRIQVNEADAVVALLAEVVRRAGRTPGVGRPRRLTVPLPAYLTPLQVATCQDRFDNHPDLSGRVRLNLGEPGCSAWLDEATAVCFWWVREHRDDLERRCRIAPGQPITLFILDAGADTVDVALIELHLHAYQERGLSVAPRLVARDGFRWLSGDRATAAMFRRLKARVAHSLLGRHPANEQEIEATLPTRFGGRHGEDQVRSFNNFHVLWDIAERWKSQEPQGGGWRGEVSCLTRADGRSVAPTIAQSAQEVEEDLREEATQCLERCAEVLTCGIGGELARVDRILITGGGSRLPLFRRDVLGQLGRRLERGGVAVSVEDLSENGKEVVATGAALATWYRDTVSVGPPTTDQPLLRFIFDQFHRRLPFSLAAGSSDGFRPLFDRGTEFPSQGGRLGPLLWSGARPTEVLALYRFPGLRQRPVLADYIGDIVFPTSRGGDPQNIELKLAPNLILSATWQGATYELRDRAPQRVREDPWAGYLL